MMMSYFSEIYLASKIACSLYLTWQIYENGVKIGKKIINWRYEQHKKKIL
jgi:hypothetical protein